MTAATGRAWQAVAVEYAVLQNEVRTVSRHLATLLRAAPDGQRRVTGLDWTVGELGAHLVTVARRNIGVTRGSGFAWGATASPHAAMATVNQEELAALDESDPLELASMLERENDAVLDAYGPDGDRAVQWPQYEGTAMSSTSVWLGELLVHGLDLARTFGHAWPIRADQATAIFTGLTPAMPAFVNRAVAGKASGVYHVHLRGDGHYSFDVAGGEVAVREGKPPRADLHVSADPVSYLLVGYGRANRWGAIARGAIFAWGTKPWLALRFADLFERP